MEQSFGKSVCELVGQIPAGRVMTYGQIAALCGSPGAARVVGQIAHFGQPGLPWHRVVNARGGMASGFVPGGKTQQQRLLAAEGIVFRGDYLDLNEYVWWPTNKITLKNPVAQGRTLSKLGNRVSILAIIGPTASGKTGLAIEIAKKYNGEVIAADSRTVYKGLDIGTAKPTPDEQQGIKHWGLDLVGPGESFSVADFKKYADEKIADISSRGKMPILVGGSGLYVDAVLYDYSLAPTNETLRNRLSSLGVIELKQMITEKGYEMPQNDQNKRHLIRTLERGGLESGKKELAEGTVIIGLNPSKDILKKRVAERAGLMLEAGVMKEVKWAFENYPIDSEALTGGIYRIFRDVIWGDLPKEVAVEKFVYSDMHLAKRQITWFKRNPDINWFDSADSAFSWFDESFSGTL